MKSETACRWSFSPMNRTNGYEPRRTIVRNAKRRCEIENAKSEEFDIDYDTERRGQYDYRPDYTDKH